MTLERGSQLQKASQVTKHCTEPVRCRIRKVYVLELVDKNSSLRMRNLQVGKGGVLVVLDRYDGRRQVRYLWAILEMQPV